MQKLAILCLTFVLCACAAAQAAPGMQRATVAPLPSPQAPQNDPTILWPHATAYPAPEVAPDVVQNDPPTVTVAWEGTAARVTWQGLPVGACVVKGRAPLSDTCSASGSLLLTGAGRDAAYAPRGGEVYVVIDPTDPLRQRILARAVLSSFVVTLPRVVH